jgi:hypothetical protein
MKKMGIFLMTVFMTVFLCPDANATIGCTPDDPAPILLKKHNEKPLAKGMSSRGALITIYVSAKGTWTIIAKVQKDVFCILDMGGNFAPVISKKKSGSKS